MIAAILLLLKKDRTTSTKAILFVLDTWLYSASKFGTGKNKLWKINKTADNKATIPKV